MAKQGMKRPNVTHTKPKNKQAAVPEIQGKAKNGKEKANSLIAGTKAPNLKMYHSEPHGDKPSSQAHGIIDTDLAKDNLENNLSAADLQDL